MRRTDSLASAEIASTVASRTLRPLQIHLGDVTTWLAVIAATFGGYVALRQLP